MAASKWLKKVQKELKASPAKAAALGGGLLLAVIFWAPLVSKWMKPKSGAAIASAPDTTAPLPSVTATFPTASANQALATQNSLADWLKTIESRKTDLLATSVRWPDEMRSPFVRTRHLNEFNERMQRAEELATKAKIEQESEPVEQLVMFEPPTDWTLTATTCGTKRKLAHINGRIYREGETLQTAQGAAVIVKSIEPRRVVLAHGQYSFELFIPQVATQ